MNYEQYIQSAEWKALRQKVLERDRFQCQTCCSTDDLEVHHRTYDRLFHEDLEDLITLCHECHEAITCVIRKRRYEAKAIELSSVQRLSTIVYRGKENAEIEISTHVRITPNPPQRTDSRSNEQIFKGFEENQRQERQDGRRF